MTRKIASHADILMNLGSALRLHSEEGQQMVLCTETTQEVQSSMDRLILFISNLLYTRVCLRCLRWFALEVSCLLSRERTKKGPFHHLAWYFV